MPFPRLSHERQSFYAQAPAALVASVLQILAEQEGEKGPFDFDSTMEMGLILGRDARVAPADVAGAAIHWLRELPSERRVGVVSAMFNGLFQTAGALPFVREHDLQAYLDVVSAVRLSEEKDNVKQVIDIIEKTQGLPGDYH